MQRWIDELSRWLGRVSALLLVAIVLLQFGIVVLRYAFGIGFIQMQEMVAYIFGVIVLLGIPLALLEDQHVRVDVFRRKRAGRVNRMLDRAAILFLLVPTYGSCLYFGWPLIEYSWSIREGSVETGGLPGLYLVKSALVVLCVQMILQGLSLLYKGTDSSRGR